MKTVNGASACSGSVTVIGGGLAGCEAALQVARSGIRVTLFEMRPSVRTAVHQTDGLAELVCSNSLGSMKKPLASALLKEELEMLGCRLLEAAKQSCVPAGHALAVDRVIFSKTVEKMIGETGLIDVVREEVTGLPQPPAVIATGPLTSRNFEKALSALFPRTLYFYDAVSPIVAGDSLDMSRVFSASRHDPEGEDYLNIALDEKEYADLVERILRSEVVPVAEHDRPVFFEACLPVEELARRGPDTLRYGPLKPVGIRDPRTGKTPYAVIQLRREDMAGSAYNLVGFQTRMKWPAQKELIASIPGLSKAEILRYGVMHRNTYIDSRRHLFPTLESRELSGIFFAGQITGVEGYVESIATGLLAGLNVARKLRGQPLLVLPPLSMLGALLCYITGNINGEADREEHSEARYGRLEPMNANYGLLPRPDGRFRKNRMREYMRLRSLEVLAEWIERNDINSRR